VNPTTETDLRRSPRRSGQRSIGAAEGDTLRDFDDAVIAAVNQAWGALLGGGPSRGGEREHAQLPPMTVLTSAASPDLIGLPS
jgi:hypothetical protein